MLRMLAREIDPKLEGKRIASILQARRRGPAGVQSAGGAAATGEYIACVATRLGLEVVGRWGGKCEGEGLKVTVGTCLADTAAPAQPVPLHRGWGPTATVCRCNPSRAQAC